MKIEHQSTFDKSFCDYELAISFGGYVVTDESWRQTILQSPWSRLYYVMDGSGIFECEGKSIKIEPGYVYLAPCGIPYGFHGTDSLKKLFFHINIIMPDGYDLFSSPDSRIVRFERSQEEMESFLAWYRSEGPKDHIRLKSEMWRTVSEAIAALQIPGTSKAPYSETVTAAIAYIRTHLSAGLTVSSVADAVFCSAGGLSERFKKEMGISVAKYIDDLLMFEARRMLAEGKKTVGEISSALGYCDQFYFSRCFTRRFSIAPKDYKKSRGKS